MQSHKILRIHPKNPHLQHILSKEFGISEILAQVLANRGIQTPQQAQRFLDVRLEHLLDPYQFADMPKAVTFIRESIKRKEKMIVFSDYDVDGITSLALLKSTLLKLGADVLHYLPHRIKEGYGLNKNVIQFAKQKHAKLVLTADCGTNSRCEIEELRRSGFEVIVTDHHEPTHPAEIRASCIINPKLKHSEYAYRDLAGVGVAFKLCQALTGTLLSEELDLVSLGTIADVVPLTGENRVIAKFGLSRLSETERVGLRALIQASRLKSKKMNSDFVSYILGPRINASGRIDSAETALHLLMSEDSTEAEELANVIEGLNRQRQRIEGSILEEAEVLIDKEINFKDHKVIVIAKEDWHQGVLGIVASKLAERFYRPTILISKGKDACKGSGRSIKNFHLFHALLECGDLLESFGGHSHAVGLVISKEKIEHFRHKINALAKERLLLEDLLPAVEVDMELSLQDLDEQMVMQLERLEPFGTGNPQPLFYTRSLKLKGRPYILSRDTLKFWVTDDSVTYPVIGFGMGSLQESLLRGAHLDLVYCPRIDIWEGDTSVILEAKEIFVRSV